MRYVVALTIDRHPPGTDVTNLYTPDQLEELVRFGYLEEAADAREARTVAREAREKAEEQGQDEVLDVLPEPAPEKPKRTANIRSRRKEGD